MVRSHLLAGVFAAALPVGLGSAAAAPQILGIVATNGALPLSCTDQGCRADLSTFCLQQPRANPEPGQQYRLAESGSVTLVGSRADGAIVRLPAGDYITFASDRGFTAVEIDLPPAVTARLGFIAVAVEVAPDASLLPVAVADDPDPQSSDEIALAVGAYRRQGGTFFDASGEAGDAIRLTNRMINTLPWRGRRPADTDGHLIDLALQSSAGLGADPAGVRLARAYHDGCRVKVDVTHHVDSMRSCLQGTHDRLVTNTNVDFWRSLNSY
jgi:hypothetical protein